MALVCHENRGLTEHIKDVTHRLAVALLSRQGGAAAFSPEGAQGNTPPEQLVQDFISGWLCLQDQPFTQAERVGMGSYPVGR